MSEGTAALMGDNGNAEPQENVPESTWTSGLNEDTSAYVQNKGWQGVQDVLNSYRNLEKFAGGSKNLVELPGVDADEEAMSAFYNKLGRPESADAYQIDSPDDADTELTEWFKNTAHVAGLTDRQAAQVYSAYNEMLQGRMEAAQQDSVQVSEQAVADLKKEWGRGFDTQIEAGKRAANVLGYDEASLSELENKLGTADMLRLFATVGSKIGEASFKGGEQNDSGFSVTPVQAQQKLNDLKMDKSFMDQYMAGNKEAVSKYTRLMEAAYA